MHFHEMVALKQIEEYRLELLIGSGSFADVWSARDKDGNRVAIKLLHKEMSASVSDCKRFYQEASLLKTLKHPNVVRVISCGKSVERPYLILEYVEGEPLSKFISRGLQLKDTLSLMAQVGDGLAAAHERQIIHRDLKPENILVTPDKIVKIVDWGIAKAFEVPKKLTKTGIVLGTPQYMSPDQITSGKVDHRTDLYSFGVILFECCAGRLPFIQKTIMDLIQAHLFQKPPQLKSLCKVPNEMSELVNTLLSKDILSRPSSAAKVSQSLKIMRETLSQRSEIEEPAIRPRYSKVIIVTLVILFLVLVITKKEARRFHRAEMKSLRRVDIQFSGQRKGTVQLKFTSNPGKIVHSHLLDLSVARALSPTTNVAAVVLPFSVLENTTLSVVGEKTTHFSIEPTINLRKLLSRIDEVSIGREVNQCNKLARFLSSNLVVPMPLSNRISRKLASLRIYETKRLLEGKSQSWSFERLMDIRVLRYSKFRDSPVLKKWHKIAETQLAVTSGKDSLGRPITRSYWMGSPNYLRDIKTYYWPRKLLVQRWSKIMREELVNHKNYVTEAVFHLDIKEKYIATIKAALVSLDVLLVDQRMLIKMRINGVEILLPFNPIQFGEHPAHTDKRAWYISLGIEPKLLRKGENVINVRLMDLPSKSAEIGLGLRKIEIWGKQ